jgi:hypothetical protein
MTRSPLTHVVIIALLGATSPESAWTQAVPACPTETTPQVVHLRTLERSLALRAGDLERLPRQRIQLDDRDGPALFEGVALRDVLRLAGVPVDSLRGPQAAMVVVAEARDGYRAAFSLAELDEGFSDRLFVLADRKNGAPIADGDGPFRVVGKGEGRRSRWIRQVHCLRVVRP